MTARSATRRGERIKMGGKNLSKKERIPGIAKTLRVYHVSHTIFEGQDDGYPLTDPALRLSGAPELSVA
jgi:hypothetical protein